MAEELDAIDVMRAIGEYLLNIGVAEVTIGQVLAIAEAAGTIAEAFAGVPPATADDRRLDEAGRSLQRWLEGPGDGQSARLMARTLAPEAGIDVYIRPPGAALGVSYPSDAADFARCLRLLDAVPALRPHLPAMAAVSPAWRRLFSRWEELEARCRDVMDTGKGADHFRRRLEDVLLESTS